MYNCAISRQRYSTLKLWVLKVDEYDGSGRLHLGSPASASYPPTQAVNIFISAVRLGAFGGPNIAVFFGFTPRCRLLSHGVVKTPFSTGVTRCLFSVSMTHWYTSGSSYCRLIPPPFLHISLCTTLIVSFNVGTSWLDCSDPRQDHLSQYVGTAIDAITRQITQQILKIFLNLVNLIWCHIHAAQFVPLYYWMCWAVSSSSSWIFSDSSWSRFKHLYRCQSQGLLQKGPL